jgi:hypothetical protein
MCGHIKKLRYPDRPATAEEIDAAVAQFLRKITNVRRPSAKRQPAFDAAAHDIAAVVREMLDALVTKRVQAAGSGRFRAPAD